MLYFQAVFYLLKLYSRFAIRIWCSRIVVNHPEWMRAQGPLLLAANHPNSFLDGIIVSTLFDRDVYSLARGDAFQHPFVNRILRYLRLLPVYRTSEGVENLEHNYTTFDACLKQFKQKDTVLIFSEGSCFNEWRLRLLRKGTARLAASAWESGIPLTVLPLGINYNSFKRFGKEVHLNFGKPFGKEILPDLSGHGRQLLAFNQVLYKELSHQVYQVEPGDEKKIKGFFTYRPSLVKKLLLAVPAALGVLLHYPLYLLAMAMTFLRFRNSEFYDGVLVALLLLSYPFYLALMVYFGNQLAPYAGWSLLLISPLSLLAFSRLNFFRV